MAGPTLDTRRVAVLPFANISADAADEYFSDGMTEELISQLSKIGRLRVIARTSIMKYKGTNQDIAEIGRALQVGTILEGSVRKAGNQVRITAQLIDVASQAHLWSEDYDRALEDVFAIQSDIAKQVAEALQITLLADEQTQIEQQDTADLEAHNSYLKGLYFYNQGGVALEKSRTYFEQAIERDPGYAMAYARLADLYTKMPFSSNMPAAGGLRQGQSRGREGPGTGRCARRSAQRPGKREGLCRLGLVGGGAGIPEGDCAQPQLRDGARRVRPQAPVGGQGTVRRRAR